MKKRLVVVVLVLAGSLSLAAQQRIDYRFDEVRRKVMVSAGNAETAARSGSHAQSGDRVRTGWFSYALLAAPDFAARFEVFAASEVRLSSGTPGVLLSLERGRVKAAFDKITGNEPRMLQTPGALLAVRGTRYGVEVDRDGVATLVVFEGAVEVLSPMSREPLLVNAGTLCRYGRHVQPAVSPLGHGMDERTWNRHGAGMGEGMRPDGGMDGMSGSHGRSNPGRSGRGHHGNH